MDIKKLKIEKFKNITLINFPEEIDLGIKPCLMDTEVIIYYINKLNDVDNFVSECRSIPLPKENRAIMVFKKR